MVFLFVEERCQSLGSHATKYFTNRMGQVALMVALRHVETGNVVVVCSTHISACWKTPVRQLVQAQEVCPLMVLKALTMLLLTHRFLTCCCCLVSAQAAGLC